jgi:hypothetical protein
MGAVCAAYTEEVGHYFFNMSMKTALVMNVKHSSSVSASFILVMLLHCGNEGSYITISATSVGCWLH